MSSIHYNTKEAIFTRLFKIISITLTSPYYTTIFSQPNTPTQRLVSGGNIDPPIYSLIQVRKSPPH